MHAPLYRLADRWIARQAKPDPDAIARVQDKQPAVVVTGASRGIGAALAFRFARAATHRVVLVARDEAALSAVADHIAKTGLAKPLVVPLDITDADAPRRIDAALSAHGLYLDYLVNNAGLGLAGQFLDHEEHAIDALVELNIEALTRLMRHALPALVARSSGGILNVASMGGFVPGPHQAAYYASKAYVISLTEAVAYEQRGTGVRIAVVAPGPVTTGFHDAMQADGALYRRLLPMRSPEMVARSAYRGLRLGRTVIVPGIFEQLAAAFTRFLPRLLVVWMISTLLKKRP